MADSEQIRSVLDDADDQVGRRENYVSETVRIQDALAAMVVVELRRIADALEENSKRA